MDRGCGDLHMQSRPASLGDVRSGHKGRETSVWTALVAKLKQCGNAKDLPEGKRLHFKAIEAGCHKNRYVAHSLITMYSKCGSMQEAMDVFKSMLQHDVVSWNSLILGYVENGESLVGLDVFIRMDCARDSFTFVAALKACKHSEKQAYLEKGMAIHRLAKEQGLDMHVFVANSLIEMYRRNGSMRDAREAFERIIQPGAVSWNSIMFGYVENGESLLALEMFARMDCAPNKLTFVAALKACGSLATGKVLDKKICLEKGMVIHKQARETGLEKQIFVANTLIDMYSKCGSMKDARTVFDNITQPDTVSWNSLMLGYVENGECSVAFEVFTSMDCAPESITFVAAFKACAGLATGKEMDKKTCLLKGTAIHGKARECGFHKQVFMANSSVDMYGKCGSMRDAQNVFDSMVQRDVFSWNSLIVGYVENGQFLTALDVFSSMDCAPDSFTFAATLKSCAGLATENQLDRKTCLSKGLAIHTQARERGFDKHVFVATTVVDMYSKCGSMEEARDVFERMPQRDAVSWNSLMLGYVDNREYSMALDVFSGLDCAPNSLTFVAALKACAGLAAGKEFDKKACLVKGMAVHRQTRELGFERDLVVANTLIDMYSKCGSMQNAREVFESIQRDVVSWSSLIMGYVENGECLVALDVYASMDCRPDSITFVGVLKACVSVGALGMGYRVHSRICELGLEEDEMVATCLVDFYGKCGNMPVAEEVFNIMHSPDVVCWTALLGGYSSVGDTYQVFNVVKRMQEGELQMNSVTYQLVFTACSHAGMVEEGRKYFDSIGVSRTVEHYICVVDMLGRANRLQEALSLIESMPFQDNSHVWMTLLGACRKWGSVEVGRIAFHAVVTHNKDEEDVASAYALMRDIYRKLGREEHALSA